MHIKLYSDSIFNILLIIELIAFIFIDIISIKEFYIMALDNEITLTDSESIGIYVLLVFYTTYIIILYRLIFDSKLH
jgi:hypothetical protein